MNPLHMEDFVDGLFKKLTIEDLKICRSVCRLWDLRISAHLKKYWEDLKNIELYTIDEVERFEVTMANSKDKKIFSGYTVCLSVLVQLQLVGGELRFFTYQPKFLNLCLKHCKFSMEDLVRIFKLCSASVEKLVLTGWGPIECYSPAVGLIDQNQNQWLDFKFPKLKTVVSNFLISSDVSLEIIQIIQEILEKSPNLQSVESQMPKYPLYNCGLKSCGILSSVTQLTISFISWKSSDVCQNHPEDLIHMQNHGLRLKYLNLGYYVYDQSDGDTIVQDLTTIEKFLEVQCDSLESVKIVINTGSSCKLQLPVFAHCRKLDLGLFEWISELDLTKQLPQLDSLVLRILSGNLDWTKLFSSQGGQVRNLEVCDKNDYLLLFDRNFNIESVFPNISHLKINSSSIPIINFEERQNWRGSLKSMSIVVTQGQFANFDYSALKGFDGLKRIEFVNSSPREYKSFYWETNLKSLMRLDNVKFIKLYKLVVSKPNLAQLREKYIVDYIPGKLHPDEHLLIDLY